GDPETLDPLQAEPADTPLAEDAWSPVADAPASASTLPSWPAVPSADDVLAEAGGEVDSPGTGSEGLEDAVSLRVVLRLADGERVTIGTFSNEVAAKEHATSIVWQLTAKRDGLWPFFGGRFLRPETILSVDLV